MFVDSLRKCGGVICAMADSLSVCGDWTEYSVMCGSRVVVGESLLLSSYCPGE